MAIAKKITSIILPLAVAVILASCAAKGDNPGREYAPNMYHSVAYEPLSQITDEEAGAWVNSLDNRTGEYFNSNRYNPHRMNMRIPPANTVKRNKYGWLPYRISKDSLDYASKTLKNPLDSTVALVEEGKVLYETYCKHCHGATGEGDGKVATGVTVDGVQKSQVAGVANLKSDALKNISEGHIFHVITMGKGLMQQHGSQVNPDERWKIAKYVKTLQK
ncbi:MAG: c-type cytochrome [Bacteroidota bacterium]